ncbi:hypothetical protein ABT282_29165 [Streptomyces sp. NPDC000927]|uniref:hypothetical protein n=1 Tax=Streptomyces sp. NPDC000927 TaxID=3154371 RepID=UPI00332F347B
MNRSVRQATLTLADTVTDTADTASVVLGGAIGAWAGYTYYPETWSGDWRLAIIGAAAIIAAVATSGLADLLLDPARSLLAKARHQNSRRFPAPRNLDEALAAAEDDAAQRAASGAWEIDQGDSFLRDADRWRGYENGEATYYLAPGVCLHHAIADAEYGRKNHEFTLLTGDGDEPAAITGVDQIRHHLAARAAGLPIATATVKGRDRDVTRLDDLTAPF